MKRISLPLILGVVLALLLAGCGGGVVDDGPVASDDADTVTEPEEPATDEEPEPEPTPTDDQTDEPADEPEEPEPDPSTDEPTTTTIRLYFMAPGGGTAGRADPFLVSIQREVPATQRIALATLRELIDGPTAADRDLIEGISTAVPDTTLVLDVTIDDRVATVDLSREFESGGGSLSMFARLAQVVYTVTQFPTVDEVQFELDGRPVTVFSGEGIMLDEPASRADFLDLLPTVFVDAPPAGADASSPLRVTGMAAVFEATFQYRLEAADGTVLAEGFAMSDTGTGWGAFDVTLRFDIGERQAGTLTVWEYSAKDGSVQAERVTPLVLLP
jgi:germination protein M